MKRILVIEDDPIIARVYSTKYQSAGFETCTASDGQAGLDQLVTFKPDLVHLDLNIPKVNGAEVIKHIRKQEALGALPVVVLSNTYQNRLVKAALEAGASECVSKATCTPKMMLEIVEKYRARAAAALPVTESSEPSSTARSAAEISVPSVPTPETPYTAKIQRHAASHSEISSAFLARAPQKLSELRERIAPLFRADNTTRVGALNELGRITESLAGQAAIAGFEELSRAACALSAMLRDLIEHPQALAPSSVHTVVGASDFLATLLERAPEPRAEARTPSMALIIDDDPLARRAVRLALARLNLPAISVEDPRVALRLLTENDFSLVVVDVEMPEMNGYQFCGELRGLPAQKSTPVLYVTGLTDDIAREKAIKSGANDLIAKPFLPMELAVKALTLLR